MKSAPLIVHPDFPSTAVDGIEVAVDRSAGGVLSLSYLVTGRIADLVVPPRASPERRDELWKHTCFEAFIRAPQAEAYLEINLSPSSQWQVYALSGYRERAPDPALPAPFIDADGGRTRLELRATLDVGHLLPADTAWRVGLTAILEDKEGARSYWSLAHPSGKPDFHHADTFALSLPPAP